MISMFFRVMSLIVYLGVYGESLVEPQIDSRSLYAEDILNKPLAGADCITMKTKEVLFLFDCGLFSSSSDVAILRNFIMYTTKVLELDADKTRVAIATFKNQVMTTIVSFGENLTHKGLQAKVSSIVYVPNTLTFPLHPAIKYAEDNVFTEARPTAEKVIIIITSSPATAPTIKTASAMKTKGYRFFIVAVGAARNSQSILQSMVESSADDYIPLENYNLIATCVVLNYALMKAYKCNPCHPNICDNNATCTATLSPTGYPSRDCACATGYKGTLCELKDYCEPNPCHNSGICVNPIGNTVKCTCHQNWIGSKCQTANPCLKNPCMNSGQCIVSTSVPYYSCKCDDTKFTGTHCEIPIATPCNPNPCHNSGMCSVQAGNNIKCICHQNYIGHLCQTPNPCIVNPCQNNGQCVIAQNLSSKYFCNCNERYTGTHCENVKSTPCNPIPCQNYGKCTPTQNGQSYTCECVPPYYGSNCENFTPKTKLPCSPSPCKNGCACIESNILENGFYCKSNSGFIGRHCTIPTPTLVCGTKEMTVSVSQDIIQEFQYNTPSLQLQVGNLPTGNAVCLGKQNALGNYEFSIPTTPNVCGNKVALPFGSGIKVVHNKIYLNRVTPSTYKMSIVVLEFKCTYNEREITAMSRIQPMIPVAPVISSSSGSTSLKPVGQLCLTDTCPNKCPSEMILNPGSPFVVSELLHLSIITQANPGTVASLIELHMSCSPTPGQKQLPLVENGCSVDSAIVINFSLKSSGTSGTICTSFLVPDLSCKLLYLHGKLRICESNSAVQCLGSALTRTCPLSRKRSTNYEQDNNSVVVIGPLKVVLNKTIGIPFVEIYPETKRSSTVIKYDFGMATKITLASALVMLILLIFMVFLWRSKKLSNGKTFYTFRK